MDRWGKIKKYLGASLMVCALIMAAVFLPQRFSKLQDQRYLGKVTAIEETNAAISYDYNSSLESKLEILSQVDRDEVKFEPQSQSADNLVNAETMIKGIAEEVQKLQEKGLLWPIEQYAYEDHFAYAQLYNMENTSNPNNPNKSVVFWYMRFTDYSTFDFCLSVDAYTYKIYAYDIAAECIASEFKERSRVGANQDEGGEISAETDQTIIKKAKAYSPWKESKNYYGADGAWPTYADEVRDRYELTFPSMNIQVAKYWYSRPVGEQNLSAVSYGLKGITQWMRRVNQGKA